MEKQRVIGSDKPRATTRARVCWSRERRPPTPNSEPRPNLSKVPFVSTTSLNSVFRTWDHFGAENVLYEQTPRIYDNDAPRLPNQRVARILWCLYNEKELVPGFLGGWVGSSLFSKGGAYNVGTYKKSNLCYLFFTFFNFNPFSFFVESLSGIGTYLPTYLPT
jgi:hypothetical protein